MMPAIKVAFDLLGENVVDLSNTYETLTNKTSSLDEKWLGDSKTGPLKQFNAEKKASLNMMKVEKQLKKKQYLNGTKHHFGFFKTKKEYFKSLIAFHVI